jgi:hypothetical protein
MTARSSRRWLLIGAVASATLYALWLIVPLFLGEATPDWMRWGVVGTPAWFIPTMESRWGYANAPLFLALMLVTQWMFLRPVRRAALHGDTAARPRWPVLAAVSLIAAMLTAAVVATLLEFPNWWAGFMEFALQARVPVILLVLWLLWAGLFYVYYRDGDFLAKTEVIVRALIRGSGLELLIAIPTHAFVYRRGPDECFCARGSYTGIVLGTAVLLWAFGPGIMLLFLRERRRREPILQKLCPRCGATLDATQPDAPCPKCGHLPAH